jgi:iron(III) transport system ATP-binding protein
MGGKDMNNKLIEVKNISKKFGDTIVLQNLSCTLNADDINVIIGASGAGKTTLFRCIAGLETIDEGEIYIDGVLVSSKDVHIPPHKRNVGIVFQDFALFPHLNVKNNIKYGIKNKEEAEFEIDRLLKLVQMEAQKEYNISDLSGGQQQRVALARTIASKPKYILFDEAFNAFDMQMKQVIKAQIINILEKEKITPIFITHNQKEAFG